MPSDDFIAASLFIAFLLPYIHFFPSNLGYVIALFSIIIIILASFITKVVIRVQGLAVFAVAIIISIQIFHLFSASASPLGLARPTVYILEFSALVYIFPQLVKARAAFRSIALISLILSVIALPTLFIGTIGPMEPWRGITTPIPGIDWRAPMHRSVLSNPNQFGLLTAVGALAAIYEGMNRTVRWYFVAIGLMISVLLTTSRGSILMLTVGSVVLLISYIFPTAQSREAILGVSIIGGGIIIGLILTQSVSLSGRGKLWSAAIGVAQNHLLIGHGAKDTGQLLAPHVSGDLVGSHTHNTYLRLLLTSGMIGAGVYAMTWISAFLIRLKGVNQPDGPLILGLTSGFIVNQMFEVYSIFGLSPTSFTAAITLGYAFSYVGEVPDESVA